MKYKCSKCGKGEINMTGNCLILMSGECGIKCKECGGNLKKILTDEKEEDRRINR